MGFEIENNILKKYYEEGSVTNVAVPDGVTKIGEAAFLECKILESVTIPDSVIEIDERAFYRCQSLININLSNNITKIGKVLLAVVLILQ